MAARSIVSVPPASTSGGPPVAMFGRAGGAGGWGSRAMGCLYGCLRAWRKACFGEGENQLPTGAKQLRPFLSCPVSLSGYTCADRVSAPESRRSARDLWGPHNGTLLQTSHLCARSQTGREYMRGLVLCVAFAAAAVTTGHAGEKKY